MEEHSDKEDKKTQTMNLIKEDMNAVLLELM